MALTARQELFVLEYLKDLNATQAAIRAGYSAKDADVQGPRLLGNVGVQAAVAEAAAKREQRVQIQGDFVLDELHGVADFDILAIFNEDGSIKPVHEMPVRVRKAIASIEVEELFEGRGESREQIGHVRKIKFWSKDKALELLARHKSLLNDKLAVEHSGEIGVRTFDDEERAASINAIFAAVERRLRAPADGTDLV